MGGFGVKLDLTLGLADRPGELVKALEPIAKNGGNIISVLHERGKRVGGFVPVSLVADFPTSESFERAIKELEAVGVSIIKSEEIIEKSHITCILIGMIDMGKVSRIEDARIINFEVLTPASKEACIKLNIEAPIQAVNKILKKLKEIAKEEKAVLISSV